MNKFYVHQAFHMNCVTGFRVMSDCHSHIHCSLGTSLYQTLDELDFERGIWYAGKFQQNKH